MSSARATFLERLSALKVALNEESLVSRAPAELDRNNTARLLRNGLAVVGFALLEDFLKNRLSEILRQVGWSQVPFAELPELLRKAATVGAVKALAFQADLRRGQMEDCLDFVQKHAQLIGSTASVSYGISGLSLGWDRSNLSAESVNEILRVFKIKDGWGNIDAIARRVGVASPSHRDAFHNAATRRHQGAHSAGADIEISHLASYVHQAIGIAIGFDSLISQSLCCILRRDSDFLVDSGFVEAKHIEARFIDPMGDHWREMKEGGKRATRLARDVHNLMKESLARRDTGHPLIVIRDASLRPTNWHFVGVE